MQCVSYMPLQLSAIVHATPMAACGTCHFKPASCHTCQSRCQVHVHLSQTCWQFVQAVTINKWQITAARTDLEQAPVKEDPHLEAPRLDTSAQGTDSQKTAAKAAVKPAGLNGASTEKTAVQGSLIRETSVMGNGMRNSPVAKVTINEALQDQTSLGSHTRETAQE